MPDQLPEKPADEGPAEQSGHGWQSPLVAFRDLHYYGNDLSELRKLAEQNPKLAEKIIDQREASDVRRHVSYRLGLGTSVLFAALLFGGLGTFIVFVGIWNAIGVAIIILAVALLVRVVLTGEWSDTSWFSRAVQLLAKALGSNA